MQPEDLKLFHSPKDRLRLTVGDEKSYHTVKPAWAAPLSRPRKFLVLLDGKGEEIVTLPDAECLPAESRAAVEYELRQRYLTSTVSAILHAKQEFGATYWSVTTERGERDFVTQSLQENALWFSDDHLLLIDVDGNRFEITSVSALDERSRAYIRAIL